MNLDDFSRRELEFKLYSLVNKVVPKITKLKAPTKVHYEKMNLLAERTEAVVNGEYPCLRQLSVETGKPVLLQTRLAKSYRVRVKVNFHSKKVSLDIYRDLSAESKKRPIDDATPHMLLNGAYDYVKEENARNILKNHTRLEKLVMLNAGKLEKYEVMTVQEGIAILKPAWNRTGSLVFFKLDNGVELEAERVLFVDVVHNKLWKYDRDVKGYECDKFILISERPARPDEIPVSVKKALLAEMV